MNDIKLLPISDIIVPEAVLNTIPKRKKVQKELDYYKEHGKFEKPFIVRNKNMHLQDSYSRYIAAKELGLNEISVEFV